VKGEGCRDKVYAVILAGGKGKRLRPLSTDARPKPFLSVTGDRLTMFARTAERVGRLIPEKDILVVANKAHAGLVKEDMPGIDRLNLLLEPVSRNTAPAIAWAAKTLENRLSRAIMVVIPADQYIEDDKGYLKAVRRGVDFVRRNDRAIVVLGIRPGYPATEFGYVRVKGKRCRVKGVGCRVKGVGCRVKGVAKVERFIEKPDRKTARRYVKDGRYLWNAGAFIFRAETILKNIDRFAPEIGRTFRNNSNFEDAYKLLPDISIDYAVMEKSDEIFCVTGSYGWADIGNFENLKKVLKRESRDYIEKDSRVVKIL